MGVYAGGVCAELGGAEFLLSFADGVCDFEDAWGRAGERDYFGGFMPMGGGSGGREELRL